jgi:hypothetical protein
VRYRPAGAKVRYPPVGRVHATVLAVLSGRGQLLASGTILVAITESENAATPSTSEAFIRCL